MNDPGPLLRLAVAEDAPAIAGLSRVRIETGLHWRWTAPRVRHSILDRQSNVLVALDPASTRLLGFGIMKYLDSDAHLLLFAVAQSSARKGLGRTLLKWLEACASVAGLERIVLESRLTNHGARAFYANAGYRETETLPGYYQGVEAAVRLVKELRPESTGP